MRLLRNIQPVEPEKKVVRSMETYTKVPVPVSCRKQDAFYVKTGILMLSQDKDGFIGEELPELRKAYNDFDIRSGNVSETLLASVDEC